MSKIAIQPTSLPLGLGTANYMEIVVTYSIGDESTDLQIFYYDNLVQLNVSPQVIPVPVSEMQTWGYDFSQIVEWVANQTGAEFPQP
jgi:hypothetical protein